MKKVDTQRYINAFFLLILLGTVVYIYRSGRQENRIAIAGQIFSVETVSKQADLEKGLGGRESLCDDCAMLFVFPKRARLPFWMKGMRFDLDIIWISGSKIVHIEKNFSKDSKDMVTPEAFADKVIEINAGLSDKYGFEIGDMVDIR